MSIDCQTSRKFWQPILTCVTYFRGKGSFGKTSLKVCHKVFRVYCLAYLLHILCSYAITIVIYVKYLQNHEKSPCMSLYHDVRHFGLA